jgi:hypothetical protein
MVAPRQHSLTPRRHDHSHRAGLTPPPFDPTDDDQLARRINELEQSLQRDDPSLAKELRKLEQRDNRNAVAVFSLLVISAGLLATSFATTSTTALAAWVGAGTAYLASFLVDHRHQRKLRQPSPPMTTAAPWQ